MSKLETDLYTELHEIAAILMRRERIEHTLQPTALAHEAFLRLGDGSDLERADFLARAARTMRRILVDHARKRRALRRGGEAQREELLVDLGGPEGTNLIEVLALEEALCELEELAPRRARVVELLFFAGLNTREAAAALDLGSTTVEDDWYLARAWLRSRLC